MAQEKKGKSKLLVGLIVVGVIVAIPVFFCGLAAIVGGGGGRPTVSKDSILTIHLAGSIEEAPTDNPFATLLGPSTSPSLFNLRRTLKRAAKDDRVSAVLLEIEPLSVGMATVEEVGEILEQFKADSEKPVYAILHGDFSQEAEYLVATNAEKIWANPESGLMLNGFVSYITFFRGTLEKLKIQPESIMYKEYKSAGESFTRRKMSPAFRESYDYVISDFFNRFLDTVSTKRGIDRKEFRKLVDTGLLTANQGKDAKLLDELGYRQDVIAALGDKVGLTDPKTVSFRKYVRAMETVAIPSGDRIALVYGLGQIVASGESNPFGDGMIHGPVVAQNLEDAVKDDDVKAIVFRVNSPGGSAVGSDFIWNAVEKAKVAKKPVVVSMGDVAGSGGYWVSMNADAIVAQPSTITGSIGVVFQKFNLKGFYNWIGVDVDKIQKGKNADLLSAFNSMSPSDETTIRNWMDMVYDDFVVKVGQGRGLDPADVEKIAKGRIWTGAQAKDRKLVDEVGGLGKAIEVARKKAGLTDDIPVVIYPRTKTFFELLAAGEFNVGTAPQLQQKEPTVEDMIRFVERELAVSKPMVLMPNIEIQ